MSKFLRFLQFWKEFDDALVNPTKKKSRQELEEEKEEKERQDRKQQEKEINSVNLTYNHACPFEDPENETVTIPASLMVDLLIVMGKTRYMTELNIENGYRSGAGDYPGIWQNKFRAITDDLRYLYGIPRTVKEFMGTSYWDHAIEDWHLPLVTRRDLLRFLDYTWDSYCEKFKVDYENRCSVTKMITQLQEWHTTNKSLDDVVNKREKF